MDTYRNAYIRPRIGARLIWYQQFLQRDLNLVIMWRAFQWTSRDTHVITRLHCVKCVQKDGFTLIGSTSISSTILHDVPEYYNTQLLYHKESYDNQIHERPPGSWISGSSLLDRCNTWSRLYCIPVVFCHTVMYVKCAVSMQVGTSCFEQNKQNVKFIYSLTVHLLPFDSIYKANTKILASNWK
jgi:hypothetical protein